MLIPKDLAAAILWIVAWIVAFILLGAALWHPWILGVTSAAIVIWAAISYWWGK